MMIGAIAFYQATDPKLFTYGIDRPVTAIESLGLAGLATGMKEVFQNDAVGQ